MDRNFIENSTLLGKKEKAAPKENIGDILRPEIPEPLPEIPEQDLSEARIDSREEDLARIDELEEEAGFDLTETKKELGDKIEEQSADAIRDWLEEHISSSEYSDKLLKEFDGDEEKAKKAQGERLKSLRDLKTEVLSAADITNKFKEYKSREYPRELLDKILDGLMVFGFYDKDRHGIAIPNDAVTHGSERSDDEIAIHELGHAVTKNDAGIPDRTMKILEDSYIVSGNNPVMDGYLTIATERLVRKQKIDFEMERLGIKKYGEKFTKNHYDELMEYYKKGELSVDAEEFIRTTKPEYFEIIFNEIAKNEVDSEKRMAA